MGCFSFICQRTDTPVLSTSCEGESVHLFLLKEGRVIEEMFGNYDSYGRVFNISPLDKDRGYQESFKWNLPWGEICNLMFDNNPHNGIAAIKGWDGKILPTEISEQDPDQGWGKKKVFKQVLKPYHKVY